MICALARSMERFGLGCGQDKHVCSPMRRSTAITQDFGADTFDTGSLRSRIHELS